MSKKNPSKYGSAHDIINDEMVEYDEKPFDIVAIGSGDHAKKMPLHNGANHSYSSNSHYVLSGDRMIPFDGHRRCMRVEIEEYNYLKDSEYSGDEIRKGCKVRLFMDGTQIMDEFCRSVERGHKMVDRFIDDMEDHFSWFPHNIDRVIGKLVSYYGQFLRVTRVIVDQACIICESLDGKPRKLFVWENEEEDGDDLNDSVKLGITSPALHWHWGLDNNGYEDGKIHHALRGSILDVK